MSDDVSPIASATLSTPITPVTSVTPVTRVTRRYQYLPGGEGGVLNSPLAGPKGIRQTGNPAMRTMPLPSGAARCATPPTPVSLDKDGTLFQDMTGFSDLLLTLTNRLKPESVLSQIMPIIPAGQGMSESNTHAGKTFLQARDTELESLEVFPFVRRQPFGFGRRQHPRKDP